MDVTDISMVRVRLHGGTAWAPVPFLDERECGHCETLCPGCVESWGWDHELHLPSKVLISEAMAAVIRGRREAVGLSWADLATRAGLPLGTISSLGIARTHLPALGLRRLAGVLGVGTVEILSAV